MAGCGQGGSRGSRPARANKRGASRQSGGGAGRDRSRAGRPIRRIQDRREGRDMGALPCGRLRPSERYSS